MTLTPDNAHSIPFTPFTVRWTNKWTPPQRHHERTNTWLRVSLSGVATHAAINATTLRHERLKAPRLRAILWTHKQMNTVTAPWYHAELMTRWLSDSKSRNSSDSRNETHSSFGYCSETTWTQTCGHVHSSKTKRHERQHMNGAIAPRLPAMFRSSESPQPFREKQKGVNRIAPLNLCKGCI